MEQKVFSVKGMTCTTCSNTLFKWFLCSGLSKMKNVDHVAVCLLSEKLIIKGSKLNSEEIVDMVDMLGFEVII